MASSEAFLANLEKLLTHSFFGVDFPLAIKSYNC
jgi:hypothetical protein